MRRSRGPGDGRAPDRGGSWSSSELGHASVDNVFRAGDAGRIRREQKDHHRSDLFRRSEPAEGHASEDVLAEFLNRLLG